MKLPLLCFFVLLPAAAGAAPVHITLKPTASSAPNADGFLTLGMVAGITGGDKAARARFAAVLVARAPLSGETRKLTRGDLALKLRQAGINPDTQAVLEGADCADVTAELPPAPNNGGAGTHPDASVGPPETGGRGVLADTPATNSSPLRFGEGGEERTGRGSPSPIIHSGDTVLIRIQSGAMTITAPATARESGRVGDTIRVHRAGVMSDLSVQVLDAQTVQMEI